MVVVSDEILIKIDSRIEPHPFRPEDFARDNPFVDQILKDAIEITFDDSNETKTD